MLIRDEIKNMVDEFVYICDLCYTTFNNKAISHIRPQKVKIQLYRNYYPQFIKLNKHGETTKKIYNLYHNGGHHKQIGVFTNMKDCVDHYNKLKLNILEDLEKWKIYQDDKYNKLKKEYSKITEVI